MSSGRRTCAGGTRRRVRAWDRQGRRAASLSCTPWRGRAGACEAQPCLLQSGGFDRESKSLRCTYFSPKCKKKNLRNTQDFPDCGGEGNVGRKPGQRGNAPLRRQDSSSAQGPGRWQRAAPAPAVGRAPGSAGPLCRPRHSGGRGSSGARCFGKGEMEGGRKGVKGSRGRRGGRGGGRGVRGRSAAPPPADPASASSSRFGPVGELEGDRSC